MAILAKGGTLVRDFFCWAWESVKACSKALAMSKFPPTWQQFQAPRALAPVQEEDGNAWGHYTPGEAEAPGYQQAEQPARPQQHARHWTGDRGYGDRPHPQRQDYGQWWGHQQRGSSSRAVAAVHNSFVRKKADFLDEAIAHHEDPAYNSFVFPDNRDERVVSPFQNWLVEEIMTNAASSINVLTERDQVLPPSSGFQLSLFANYTLDGVKAILVLTVGSTTGCPSAHWDSKTAKALSHEAFQPFTWPLMKAGAATYVDVKFFNGNEVLFHWIFRGYRSDSDLTVQQQFCDDALIKDARIGRFRPSIVVSVFRGWNVTVFSFEVGGRSYAVAPQGAVVAGDHCRANCELRVCNRASTDAYGNDADRVEFRFRDSDNKVDLKCGRISVPGTWLAVSHISGRALINTIGACRSQKARIEGPDQVQQFAQLAAIFEPWWRSSIAREVNEVGVQALNFVLENEGDFHLRARSKLWVLPPEYVNQAALAHRSHQEGIGLDAQMLSGPPAIANEAAKVAVAEIEVREKNMMLQDQPGSSSRSAEEQFARRASDLPAGSRNSEEQGNPRDSFRLDMNVSRTSAAITPGVFAQVLSQQEAEFFESTVRVVPVPDQLELSQDQDVPAQPVGQPTSFGPPAGSLDGSA